MEWPGAGRGGMGRGRCYIGKGGEGRDGAEEESFGHTCSRKVVLSELKLVSSKVIGISTNATI